MPSTMSPLFRTWRYSDMASTPSCWASLRMLSASTPSLSVRSKAARSTRARLRGTRRSALGLALVGTLSTSPKNLVRHPHLTTSAYTVTVTLSRYDVCREKRHQGLYRWGLWQARPVHGPVHGPARARSRLRGGIRGGSGG